MQQQYNKIILSGYSLGGSVVAILGNDLNLETITFEAYGVGEFIEPRYTENIINFGNENDPIFLKKIDFHLGKTYIIPNSEILSPNDYNYSIEKSNNIKNIKNLNIGKHFPEKSGDIANAIEYTGRPFKLSASYDYYDDSILVPSNKVYYNGKWASEEMTREDYDTLFSQYFGNGDKLPDKEEMDRRVRFGELIYVEDYVRSDGTHVSGYYRRYPKD